MPTLQSNQTKISVLIIRVHLCSSVVQTTNNQQPITTYSVTYPKSNPTYAQLAAIDF